MKLGGAVVPQDLAYAVLAGALWGVACWWGDGANLAAVRVLTNVAGPWLLLAFALGTRSRAALPGAVLGAVALLAAILGYYLAIELLDVEQAPNRLSLDAGSAWAVAAVPVGAFFGLCGAAWRANVAVPLALGLLGGALFGEGLILLNDGIGPSFDYLAVPVAEVAAAFALPTLLMAQRAAGWTIVVVAAVGPIAAFVERGLFESVRGVIG